MWNFLVSGLSLGCTLVLYDGSPLRDVNLLWKLVDDLGITIFGTSAKYLDQLSVRCVRSMLSKGLKLIFYAEKLSASGQSQSRHFATHLFYWFSSSPCSL